MAQFAASRLAALAQDSIQLIRLNQHPTGGYAACPLFAHYCFSWLRDGSFIAYSMDTSGQHESANSFYEWVNRIISGKTEQVRQLLEKHNRSEWIGQEEYLHTRYQLDGRDDDHSEWGHFQLDGYGAWLWGLVEHLRSSGQKRIPNSYRDSVNTTVDYLRAFWRMPNFDCWEEHCDQVHPSTLACIYGGLRSIAEMDDRDDLEQLCNEIKQFLLDHAVHPEGGHFVKSLIPDGDGYKIGNDGVDASLMWLCEPFQLFAPDHPAIHATLNRIQADLVTPSGGVRRYKEDTYYGGGAWLLLTAWSGWIRLMKGDRKGAQSALEWIASKADSLNRLPEQVADEVPDKALYEDWVKRWGFPALPLLWSHAMYLVLYNKL